MKNERNNVFSDWFWARVFLALGLLSSAVSGGAGVLEFRFAGDNSPVSLRGVWISDGFRIGPDGFWDAVAAINAGQLEVAGAPVDPLPFVPRRDDHVVVQVVYDSVQYVRFEGVGDVGPGYGVKWLGLGLGMAGTVFGFVVAFWLARRGVETSFTELP